MVKLNETARISGLYDELDRLSERYQGNLDALQVVDALRREIEKGGSHELIRLEYLHELLDWQSEKHQGNLDALQVVDAVRFWAMEEEVPGVDAGMGAQKADRGENSGDD